MDLINPCFDSQLNYYCYFDVLLMETYKISSLHDCCCRVVVVFVHHENVMVLAIGVHKVETGISPEITNALIELRYEEIIMYVSHHVAIPPVFRA